MSRFPYFYETIMGVHLLEASPTLRKVQQKTLSAGDGQEALESATRPDGIQVHWHDGIEFVPRKCLCSFL